MRKVISLILSIVLCFSVLCITPTNNASAENSNICVILNGQTLNFTVQPQMTNGRLLVPMRTIFEAMGATVNWDSTTQTITANRNDITIKMQINSTKVYRNDAEVNIDTPPTIINSSTLVPVRVIAESFNADVVWNDSLSFARYIYIFDYDNINTNNDCYGKYKDIPSMVYYTGFVGSPVDGVDEASISGISTCYTYIMFWGTSANQILNAYSKVLKKHGFNTDAGNSIEVSGVIYDLYTNGKSKVYVPENIGLDTDYGTNKFSIYAG